METYLPSTDYQRIAQAIHYLETNFREQPELDELAAHLGLSPFHLQRLFTRWAGISPKRFVQFLTAAYAKQLLATSHSVLDATYEAGLSSPGRLHDLFIATEAVTPGEGDPDDPGFVPWSIDPGPVVPLLVREVQLLRARVAALEAKVPDPT